MSYQATVINVMIASPGDVATERKNIRDVVLEWNATHAEDRKLVLMPVGWDSHSAPEMGNRPQAIINERVLNKCDLLVAVFWTRLGSPTGEASSGTVEEIEKHLEAGKPAMLYFSNAPVRPDSVVDEQYRALTEFRKDCEKRGLIETYDSLQEFRDKFARQLTQTIIRAFTEPENMSQAEIPTIPSRPQMPQLSDEARVLLVEVSQDQNGIIVCIRAMDGLVIQTNGKQLTEMGNARSEAKWKSALENLVSLGLIAAQDSKGEIFGPTHEGYELADRLAAES